LDLFEWPEVANCFVPEPPFANSELKVFASLQNLQAIETGTSKTSVTEKD
jgi:hypothetical protein